MQDARIRRPEVTREAVKQARLEGMSWAEMAAHFSCSYSALYQHLRAAGLIRNSSAATARLQQMLSAGLTVKEIAEQLDCGYQTVVNRLRAAGLPVPRAPRRPREQRGREAALAELRRNPRSSEVLGNEHIVCLDCGRRLARNLATHLQRAHQATAADYRRRWGYHPAQPLRSRAFNAFIESRRRKIEDDPLPPWSAIDRRLLDRMMRRVAQRWPNAELLRPALERLLREAPRRRLGYVVWGRWTLRTDRHGQVEILSRLYATGFPADVAVDAVLREGELAITAGTVSTTFSVPRDGLRAKVPRSAQLGIIKLRIAADGYINCRGRHHIGWEYAGRRLYCFFFPGSSHLLCLDESGTEVACPAPAALMRRQTRREREASAAVRNFDAAGQEARAATWLLNRWREGGIRRKCIVVQGIIPAAECRNHHFNLESIDDRLVPHPFIRTCPKEGTYSLQFLGPWIRVLDDRGTQVDIQRSLHAAGWCYTLAGHYRGDRLHEAVVSNVALSRLAHPIVFIGPWAYILRVPPDAVPPSVRRAAVLARVPIDGGAKFTLYVENADGLHEIPIHVFERAPAPVHVNRWKKLAGPLREAIPETLLARLLRLLPQWVFDAAAAALEGIRAEPGLGPVPMQLARALLEEIADRGEACNGRDLTPVTAILQLLDRLSGLGELAWVLPQLGTVARGSFTLFDELAGFPRAAASLSSIRRSRYRLQVAVPDYRRVLDRLRPSHAALAPLAFDFTHRALRERMRADRRLCRVLAKAVRFTPNLPDPDCMTFCLEADPLGGRVAFDLQLSPQQARSVAAILRRRGREVEVHAGEVRIGLEAGDPLGSLGTR